MNLFAPIAVTGVFVGLLSPVMGSYAPFSEAIYATPQNVMTSQFNDGELSQNDSVATGKVITNNSPYVVGFDDGYKSGHSYTAYSYWQKSCSSDSTVSLCDNGLTNIYPVPIGSAKIVIADKDTPQVP